MGPGIRSPNYPKSEDLRGAPAVVQAVPISEPGSIIKKHTSAVGALR